MANFELPHLISTFFVGAMFGAWICLKVLGYYEQRHFRVGKFSADKVSFQILVMLHKRGGQMFRLAIKEKFKGEFFEGTVDSMIDGLIRQGLVDAVWKDRVELSSQGKFFIQVRRMYEGNGIMIEIQLPSDSPQDEQEKGEQAP